MKAPKKFKVPLIRLLLIAGGVAFVFWLLLKEPPIEKLISGQYTLKEIRITGQKRVAICRDKELLEYWEYILQEGFAGKAIGYPPAGERETIAVRTYSISFKIKWRSYVYGQAHFVKYKNSDQFEFVWGQFIDDLYYSFIIPDERPAKFRELHEFLFNHEHAGKTLEL